MDIEAIERELIQFLEKNILSENVKINAGQELKAAGSLIPSGSFSITSPSYSISAITAT